MSVDQLSIPPRPLSDPQYATGGGTTGPTSGDIDFDGMSPEALSLVNPEDLETPVLFKYIEWAMQKAGLEEQKLRAVQDLLTSITDRMKEAGTLLSLVGNARNVRGADSKDPIKAPTPEFTSAMISDFNTRYAELKPLLGLPDLFPGKMAYTGVPDAKTGRWQSDEEIYAAAVKHATGKTYPPLPPPSNSLQYLLIKKQRYDLDRAINNSSSMTGMFNNELGRLTTARGTEVPGGLTVDCTGRELSTAFRSIEEALSQLNLSNSREMANASEQLGTSNKYFELAKKAIEEYLGRLLKEIIGTMRG